MTVSAKDMAECAIWALSGELGKNNCRCSCGPRLRARCLAERYTIYERRPNAVPKMLVFLKTDRMAHDELVGRPASHEPTRSTIAVSPTRIEPQSRYYEK